MNLSTPIKKLSSATVLVILSGCASMMTIPTEGRFDASPKQPMQITWLAVADPTSTCKLLFPKFAHYSLIAACAGWNQSGQCTVVTGLITTHQVLGHEVRHCFEGDFHE